MKDNPIAKFRKQHGLTLEAMGELVGVQKAAVCKWENDKGPSPRLAILIEKATNGEITKADLRPDLWPKEEVAA